MVERTLPSAFPIEVRAASALALAQAFARAAACSGSVNVTSCDTISGSLPPPETLVTVTASASCFAPKSLGNEGVALTALASTSCESAIVR